MAGEKLEINEDGAFVKWIPLLDLEAKVESPSPLSSGAVPTSGTIPGIEFSQFLKPYVGKKIKIKIDILKET